MLSVLGDPDADKDMDILRLILFFRVFWRARAVAEPKALENKNRSNAQLVVLFGK